MPEPAEPRAGSPLVVESVTTLDFRNLADATVPLGAGLTAVVGVNGAGKTNLLEAVHFALVGRSCRTTNDREAIRFGRSLARSEVRLSAGPETRMFLSAISTADGRRHLVDGSEAVGSPADRPAVGVFMPDRLGLIKGAPGGRRAHLDRLSAALWPARAELRASFGRALAQRNALLARVRGGTSPESSLDAWDAELAVEAARLIEARSEACELLAEPFATASDELGLPGEPRLGYRPRCDATDAIGIAEELADRRARDLERGYTTHGPHHDELELTLSDRSIRRYGSQGQQRSALLALLFAERELVTAIRGSAPLMLLDDVMSELDADRRRMLVGRLASGGQALLTATDRGQLPSCERIELRCETGVLSPPARLAEAA